MKNINSSLILKNLVFDKIEFNRDGFKNENEIKYKIEVQVSYGKENISRVTIVLKANKESEYNFNIALSGYFAFDFAEELDESFKRDLISKNAVAILMPYLRSEVSLLTAQPGMDCLVLPPFNINKLMDDRVD